jgi:hypothetical protein
MISLDKHDIQNIVLLLRYQEFIKFIELLNKSANALAIGNAAIKDETLAKWNQGRIQELLDILKIIRSASEDLKGFKTEARKHVE